MSVKRQALALINFLTAMHKREMRLSTLIAYLGFSEPDIQFIRANHLDESVGFYLDLVQAGIARFCANNRLSHILIRRFGLDGIPPETLESLGKQLGISRERVRQLQEKGPQEVPPSSDPAVLGIRDTPQAGRTADRPHSPDNERCNRLLREIAGQDGHSRDEGFERRYLSNQ